MLANIANIIPTYVYIGTQCRSDIGDQYWLIVGQIAANIHDILPIFINIGTQCRYNIGDQYWLIDGQIAANIHDISPIFKYNVGIISVINIG